jgi:pantoate kinase
VIGETPAESGSLGAGIVISEGVRVTVERSGTTSVEVYGGQGTLLARNSPPIAYALERLGRTARVHTACTLPIGAGFGLSAAALCATITAVSEVYGLGLDRKGIAALAHEAEVVHRTGLGDVAACMGGGLVTREGVGICAPIRRDLSIRGPLAAVSYGPLPTPSVLGSPDLVRHIEEAFPRRFSRGIDEFFCASRAFARDSGLLREPLEEVLRACDAASVPASMTMLGCGIFAMGDRAAAILSRFGTTYSFGIAARGFQLEAP